jgi:hypothetical protein
LNLFLIGGITLFLACLMVFARRLIRTRALTQEQTSLPVVGNTACLRPAEIAYLVRDGDMSHTLIVMALDLIQRTVKAPTAEEAPRDLAPYEMEMWQRVKNQVRSWAEKKATDLNPLATTNPTEVLKRVNAIKVFFTLTIGRFLQDVARDPKRLKRYFTFAGIARVVADLTSAGYGAIVEEDLRKGLLARGFLVEEQKRTGGGMLSALLAGGCLVAMIAAVLLLHTYAEAPVFAAFIAAASGGVFCGLVLRALLMVPEFVPFYEEISLVLQEVSRSSWQVVVLRTLFRGARLLAWLAFGFTIGIILIVAALVFAFALHADVAGSLFALFALTIWWMAFFQLLIDAHGLVMRESKTLRAEAELERTKQDIAHATAIGTLKDVFANPAYDPTFSNLVAVYGVETIWLLTK